MKELIIILLVCLLILAVIGLIRAGKYESDLVHERILTDRQGEVIQELMAECDSLEIENHRLRTQLQEVEQLIDKFHKCCTKN
jgi:Tfp pilus assembly protein PilN